MAFTVLTSVTTLSFIGKRVFGLESGTFKGLAEETENLNPAGAFNSDERRSTGRPLWVNDCGFGGIGFVCIKCTDLKSPRDNAIIIIMEEMPAVVKATDMSEEQVNMAIRVAIDAKNKFEQRNLIAAYIKKEFDKMYEPSWHCCVGDSFGSFVTHETGNLVYFFLKEMAVLVWKAG